MRTRPVLRMREIFPPIAFIFRIGYGNSADKFEQRFAGLLISNAIASQPEETFHYFRASKTADQWNFV